MLVIYIIYAIFFTSKTKSSHRALGGYRKVSMMLAIAVLKSARN